MDGCWGAADAGETADGAGWETADGGGAARVGGGDALEGAGAEDICLQNFCHSIIAHSYQQHDIITKCESWWNCKHLECSISEITWNLVVKIHIINIKIASKFKNVVKKYK